MGVGGGVIVEGWRRTRPDKERLWWIEKREIIGFRRGGGDGREYGECTWELCSMVE